MIWLVGDVSVSVSVSGSDPDAPGRGDRDTDQGRGDDGHTPHDAEEQVRPAPDGTPTGPLPFTGAATALLLAVALILCLVAVLARRLRRGASTIGETP